VQTRGKEISTTASRKIRLATRVAEEANKNHSFIYSFIHSFIHSFVRSFVRSSVRPFSLFFQVRVLAYVKIDTSSLSIN